MDENPYRYRRNLELHESEWSHDEKKEPFFGAGLSWFLNVTMPLFGLAIVLMLASRFIFRALLGY